MQPPADAVILGISGLRGPQDHEAVQAAIARCDPGSMVWTDWPNGRVAIRSRAPVKALQAAVEALGFAAVVQMGQPGSRGTVVGVFGRMLIYAVLGGVLGVLAGVLLGLGNAVLNPDCTRPGSSGGCAIGVGLFGFVLGALGIPAGLIAGLVHGLVRLGR